MKQGYTQMKCGLIGEHLGHSFSAIIHAKIADYSYDLVELRPEEVGAFVKAGGYDAFNVTIPYKKTVMPFLDTISPEAERIGSVNTVVRRPDGRMDGYNTDYLNRIFKAHFFKTIKQYINERRMETIKSLMLTQSYTLSEIAAKSGFTEYKYFLKFFKYHEGITPTEFYKQYAKIHINSR